MTIGVRFLINGEGDPEGYFAFGHVSPQQLIQAIRDECDPNFQATPDQIKHIYCRLVPTDPDDDNESDYFEVDYRLIEVDGIDKDAQPLTAYGWD
jgi:hypothetical protein